MPKRNESIFPYDDSLKRLLSEVHTAEERRIVLRSRKLAILSDDGKCTATCVLPEDVYDRLAKMKISYRTLAYWRWRNEQHKA